MRCVALAKKLTREQVAAINAKKSSELSASELIIKGTLLSRKPDGDILDITTNKDNSLEKFPKKDFKLWIVKHPEGGEEDKVQGSDTIVRSQHYGQAVDDFIIDWNARKRKNRTIGYPVVQGKKA